MGFTQKKNQWVQLRVLTRTVGENEFSMIDNRKKILIWIRNSSSKLKLCTWSSERSYEWNLQKNNYN